MNRGSRGFTLIELMVVVVIIGLVGALAVPVYEDTLRKAHRAAIVADCQQLYDALLAYYTDEGSFPSDAEFDLETLGPLSTEGYLPGAKALVGMMDQNRALLYFAPDVDGTDTQFIVVMRAKYDTDVIPVVVHTNIIPATEGWVSGVYLIENGELEEAEAEIDG